MPDLTATDETLIDPNLADMPAQTPTKIYLKDYTPPSFTVTTIDLDIKVYEAHAVVESTLKMQREGSGELVLLGRDLQLQWLKIDGELVDAARYELTDDALTIFDTPDTLTLSTQVQIHPQTNTELEGLYRAGTGDETMYVTQCEPEGFRKITFYPDRPDVLAEFTTRVEADKRFPTLLANGNLLETGEVADDSSRHYAIWHDPTKKPSYLFACVVADLDVLTDHYTTSEGREVLLELYAKSADIDKCEVGMQALKDAMAWDELNYGRAYDLDRYMIVAVSQFNMGAMENKGLNIFNTACVLSSPETTTDARSFNVKAVIAHEYFHNWTGNRITCRDWFQLCLKEGFTVFRDQSFSADQQSAAAQRIDDVSVLRAHQFAEDSGPLAHPVRPESFVEINNFYTTTVYEKGAEIVRMMANLLGKEKFRQGTDEYFKRYDGQAVTVEDFISALNITDVDVGKFIDWYRQPGTPIISGHQEYNKEEKTLYVTLSQYVRHVEGFAEPKLLPIPIETAVFDKVTGKMQASCTLLLEDDEHTYAFTGIEGEPVVSLLRDFSAPVLLNFDYQDEDLAFLMAHETNGFNRWQATQILMNRILLQQGNTQTYLQALKQAVPELAQKDAMLAMRLLGVASERELATSIDKDYRPEAIKQKRDELKQQMALALGGEWQKHYEALPLVAYEDSAEARGQRAFRNMVLDMALTAGIPEARNWAVNQYENASCMTERFGALCAMVDHEHPQTEQYLQDFYERFVDDDLVIDLWFSVQAGTEHTTIQQIEALMSHADFDWGTPNRIRAVVGSLAAQPVRLWTEEGLTLYTNVIKNLDDKNPVLASRLLQVLARWYTLAEPNRAMAKTHLENLKQSVKSKNVTESLESLLAADKV